MAVLVVDDSKISLRLMQGLLKDLGYSKIELCENLTEAKNRLGTTEIDLVLSDLNLSGGTGIDLLKHIRSIPRLEKVPFVMITSDRDKRPIMEAARIGIQTYIFKPVQKDVLKAKLYDIAEKWGIQPPSEAMG